MKRFSFLMVMMLLAAPALADNPNSIPRAFNDYFFEPATFNCGGTTTITLNEAPALAQVTVVNSMTGDSQTVTLTNGVGSLSSLACNGVSDLVYVYFVTPGNTDGEVMVLDGAGRASGSNPGSNMYMTTSNDPLDCASETTVTMFVADGSDGDGTAGTATWASETGDSFTSPAATACWGASPQTCIYDFTIPIDTAGSQAGDGTDGSYECVASTVEAFSFTSPSGSAVTATPHSVVPVELLGFEIE